MKQTYTALGLILLATGCSTLPNPADDFTSAKMEIAGEPLQKIDLINLVDPEMRRQYLPCNINYMEAEKQERYDNPDKGPQGGSVPRPGGLKRIWTDVNNNKATEFRCALEAANTYALSWPEFQFFFAQYKNTPTTRGQKSSDIFDVTEARKRWKKLGDGADSDARGLNELLYKDRQKSLALAARRNQIQDAVLITSENYCRDFKIAMSNRSTSIELFTRIGSTATGVLSTIFVDPATVAGLAGTSTILNGWLGDYNAAYLSEKATRTISKGIDVRREQLLYDINSRRFFSTNQKPETSDPEMRNIYKLSFGIDWEKTQNFTSIDFQKQRYADLINVIYQEPTQKPNSDDSEKEEVAQIEAVPLILDLKYENRIGSGKLKATKDGSPVNKGFSRVGEMPENTGDFYIAPDGSYAYDLQKAFNDMGSGQVRSLSLTYQVTDGGATSGETPIKINLYSADRAKFMGVTSIDVYTLEMALRDAIVYHDACRIDVGLETASDALDAIDNPSVRTLEKSLEDANSIMQKLDELQNQRKKLTER